MITVYKTNYEFCGATYVLCFSLSENIDKQIKDWEAPLDKMVFDEQMATGRFRDRLPISDWYLTAMKEAQKDGIIQPYYGEISPSACIYTLQITPPTCVLGVEHTVVKETGLFNGAVKIRKARASKVARNHKKGFMIKKQEYQSLQKWECWNKNDEFTSRYMYKFLPTSLGLSITVTDTQTEEQIDISDYNDC